MEIEIHCNNKQIPLTEKEKVHLNSIEGYTIEAMKDYLDSLSLLAEKSNNEKEILFTAILALVSNVSSANFFEIIENILIEEREIYFINTFSPKLIKEISNSNNEGLNVTLKETMISIVKIFLQGFIHTMPTESNISCTSKLLPIFEAIVDLFSDMKPFNRSRHPTDKLDISESFLEHIYSILNPNAEEWRMEIKKDCMVDYLIRQIDHYSNEKLQYGGWTRAVVTEIDQNKILKVKLLGNGDIERISLNSYFILPKGTLSHDFESRENLSVGDLIDIYDANSWYLGTITMQSEKPRGGVKYKWVKFGERVYKETGKNRDRQGKRFVGWTEGLDKESSVHDPKIRMPGSLSKTIHNWEALTTYPTDSKRYNPLETFIPFSINQKKLYALPRKNELDHRDVDIDYINLIIFFGECGGFEKMSNALSVMGSYCSLGNCDEYKNEFLLFIDFIWNIFTYLHSEFCKTFLDEFVKMSFKCLSDICMITDNRGLANDKMEILLKKIKEIMSKIYIETDVKIKYELFSIEKGITLIKSSMLEKKLIGMKLITDILNNLGIMSMSMSTENLYAGMIKDYLKQENFFDLIFGVNSHTQIFQKSGDLIKALNKCNLFKEEELGKLWVLANETADLNLEIAIYKSLKENVFMMDYNVKKTFLELILSSNLNQNITHNVLVHVLEVLQSLQRSLPRNESAQTFKDIGMYISDLIFNSTSPEAQEAIINEYITFLRGLDYPDVRFECIDLLLSRIGDKLASLVDIPSTSLHLKVLRRVMNSMGNMMEEWRKNKLFSRIAEQYNTIPLLIEYMQMYTIYTKEIISSNSNGNINVLSTIHNELITEFFSFINFMIIQPQGRTRFNSEQIKNLFEIFVESPIKFPNGNTANEANLFFKFLKEAEERRVIPGDSLTYVFSLMNTSKDLELDNISLDLMKVIWNLFISINKTNGKLRLLEKNSQAARSSISSSLSCYFDTITSITLTEKMTPFNLEGFDLIFRALISSPSEINRKFVCNFILLYTLNNRNSVERGGIYYKLIEKTIASIKDNISGEILLSNANRILNSIELLKKMLEESERQGTGGVVSHGTVNKAEVIRLKANSDNLNIPEQEYKVFVIKLFKNTTVWDLKKCLANKLNLQPAMISLKNGDNQEIADTCHGKTIEEMKLKNDEMLSITRNPILEIRERDNLIDARGYLSENFKRALSEIFYRFASCKKAIEKRNEGMLNENTNINNINMNINIPDVTETELCMNREDCKRFTQGAMKCNYEITTEDNRVVRMFEKYDTDHDGLITLNNFCSFYHDSLVLEKKENSTWENLRNLGYRNDLKKITDPIEEFELTKESMPRWILSANSAFFDVLITLQEKLSERIIFNAASAWETVIKESYSFLSQVCTNPSIYRDVMSLERLQSPSDWGLYINETSYYKQLYSLEIINAFVEEFVIGTVRVDVDPCEMSILDANDIDLLNPDNKIAWMDKFISGGGLDLILQIFFRYDSDDLFTSSYLRKKCLNILLKIIRSSLLIVLRASKSLNFTKQEILQSYGPDQETNTTDIESSDKIYKKLFTRSQSMEVIQDILFSLLNTKYQTSLLKKFLYGDTCNFKTIATKLIHILKIILSKNIEDSEERLIVSSTNLLLATVLISVDNFTDMRDFLFSKDIFNFEELIIQGILLHRDQAIRNNFYKTLKNICKNLIQLKELTLVTNVVSIVQKKLFSMMSSSNANERENCRYLFNLLEKLIEIIFTAEDNLNAFDFHFSNMASNIYETLSNTENVIEDAMLSGYIRLLTILVKYDPNLKFVFTRKDKNLLTLLVDKLTLKESKFPSCPSLRDIAFNLLNLDDFNLIQQNLSTASTAQSDEIRNNIFKLILSLIESNPENLLSLFSTKLALFPVITSKKTMSTYYNPSSDKRSFGYVGIKNLGAICYINSVIQQFFNVPSFKYAVMQIDDQLGFTLHSDNPSYDDNVLHQLQKMFSYLELSNRVSFTPIEFCWAFKDSIGQRVDTQVQQDSQEFLTRFFSRMEASTERTPYKYLMQSMFGGKTCSQVICKDCGNANNNFEDFYNLSLEVKNMKSLSESLDKFTSEERIDGYKCSNCGKVTTVAKKNSLASLPNILIVHLQRIVYNYDKNTNEKVNSSLEFPRVLNLKNQCTEEVTRKVILDLSQEKKDIKDNSEFNDRVYERVPEYYEYTLVGVVVHSGHAQGGHYFSYINTSRNGSEHSWNNDPSQTNWINFNDSFVSPFDLSTLETNCFGGNNPVEDSFITNETDTDIIMTALAAPSCPPVQHVVAAPQSAIGMTQTWFPNDFGGNNNQNFNNQNIEIGQSAYMLIYERKFKSPIKLVNPMNDHTTDTDMPILQERNRYQILKEYDLFNKEIFNNPSLLNEIVYHDIYDEEKKENFVYVPFYSVQRKIPNVYFMDVINDNIEFYNDQKIFNSHFNEFLEKTIDYLERVMRNMEISNDNFDYIFLAILRFLFDVISKSSCKHRINEIVEKILAIQTFYPKISFTILSLLVEKIEKIQEFLFSSEESANEGYKKMFKNAILTWIEHDHTNSRNYVASLENEEDINHINIDTPLVFVLLDSLLDFLPVRLTKSWTKMQSYLGLLTELAQARNQILIEYFIRKDLMARCIDFFMQSHSPYYNKSDNRTEMGKSSTPKFSPLFSLIEILLSHYGTKTWNDGIYIQNPKMMPHTFRNILEYSEKHSGGNTDSNQMQVEPEQVQIKTFTMTEKDEKLLNFLKFYELATKENFNNVAVGKIMSHMMFNNYEFTKNEMLLLISHLNNGLGLKDARNLFELLAEILKIEDMYSDTRIEWIFGVPTMNIDQKGCLSTMKYRVSMGCPLDFLFVFKTFIPQTTSHTPLVDKILTKFYWSSEFLSFMNSFYNEVLYKSQRAFIYFDSLPHPKPRNSHPVDAKLKNYIMELAGENQITNQFGQTLLAWSETLIKYEDLLSRYSKDISQSQWNYHFSNLNYRPGPIFSDVISLCDNIPTQMKNELKEKKLYLFTVDYEMDFKISSDLYETVATQYRTNFYPPNDGIQALRESNTYWDLLKEDKEFELLTIEGPSFKKRRRSFRTIIKDTEKVTTLIRRYSILNLSSVPYILTFQFRPDDIAAMNTHLPFSEVTVLCKPKSLQNVITLYKEDYINEFGNYTILVTPTVHTEVKPSESSESRARNQEQQEKVADSGGFGMVDVPNEFQIDCECCGRANFYSGNENVYMCKYCHQRALR